MERALQLVHFLNLIWMCGLFIALPAAGSAFVFRKTRSLFGSYLYLLSYLIGFTTWLGASVTVLHNWGLFWMFIGFLAAGVGVVPMALIDAMFHKEWSITLQFLLQVCVLFGLRAGGWALISAAERRSRQAALSQPEQRPSHTEQNGSVVNRERIGTFEELLELDPSTVAGIRVLPREVSE